jgi:hypothetical protein
VQIEEAAFRYVGMSYAAAQDCADDMRSAFTYNSYQPWIYEDYLEGSSFIRGWH